MRKLILLFLFINFKTYSQNYNSVTKVINKGDTTHIHSVDVLCVDDQCTYKCKSCTFYMIKKKSDEYEIPLELKNLINSIPEEYAYCPVCHCRVCANILLGFYKGVSINQIKTKSTFDYNYIESLKITKLSVTEMDIETEKFYKKFPVAKLLREKCE